MVEEGYIVLGVYGGALTATFGAHLVPAGDPGHHVALELAAMAVHAVEVAAMSMVVHVRVPVPVVVDEPVVGHRVHVLAVPPVLPVLVVPVPVPVPLVVRAIVVELVAAVHQHGAGILLAQQVVVVVARVFVAPAVRPVHLFVLKRNATRQNPRGSSNHVSSGGVPRCHPSRSGGGGAARPCRDEGGHRR